MDCGGESSPSIPVVQRPGRPQLALHRIKVLSVCNSGRDCHTSEQTPTWERQCWQPGFLGSIKHCFLSPAACVPTHPLQFAAARERPPRTALSSPSFPKSGLPNCRHPPLTTSYLRKQNQAGSRGENLGATSQFSQTSAHMPSLHSAHLRTASPFPPLGFSS